jgi:hypothetical protein
MAFATKTTCFDDDDKRQKDKKRPLPYPTFASLARIRHECQQDRGRQLV